MSLSHKAICLPVIALVALTGCCTTWADPTPTPGFWGVDDFEGSYDPTDDLDLNAETSFNGDILFANLDRGVVDDVLPWDLQLAPNIGDMPLKHPVVLVFGEHTNLRSTMPQVEAYDDYRELILVIPFVRKVGHTKWHNYVVRMYLDWQLGVDGGNMLYGYRKELAVLPHTTNSTPPPDFTVQVTQSGAMRFSGDVTGAGAWLTDSVAATSLTNYQAMKTIFRMPMLGTWPAGYYGPSPSYVCSYFEWNFDAAKARAVTTRFEFKSEFTPNMSQWVSLGPLSNLANGDFEVSELVWRLTVAKLPCDF